MNKWTAEELGIKHYISGQYVYYNDDDIVDALNSGKIKHCLNKAEACRCLDRWDMQNPVCRELVRETLNLSTSPNYQGGWYCQTTGTIFPEMGFGITIEEAEIKCIQAIMEAE